MARPRILPSDSTLVKWVDEGLTHEQITARIEEQTGYRPSRSTVSASLSKAGLTTPIRYTKLIPWRPIKLEHNTHRYLTNLRIGARIEQGLPVSDGEKNRWENFYRNILDARAILVYIYDSPEGFYTVHRYPDEEGIVRPPDSKYPST
jgi:hypothetical protein